MFTRLNMTIGSCLLMSTTALAQVGVDFRHAAKTVGPATIAVVPDKAESNQAFSYFLDPASGQAGLPQAYQLRDPRREASPIRSGFVVAADLVISCQLRDEQKEVKVVTRDGRKLTGQVVARDHVTGLAAIRVENGSLSSIALSDAAAPAGSPALVSWLHDGKIATSEAAMIASQPNSQQAMLGLSQMLDADFSPQKLGAPVVDVNGSLVGVVVNRDGVTVCISVDQVARIIEAAAAEEPSDLYRGRLGIRLDESQGSTIVEVMDDTVAEKAELKAGDRITKIGDRECKSHSDVMAMVAMSRAGDELDLEVERGAETFERTLELASAGPEPRVTSFYHGRLAPKVSQQLLQLKDGKLVPMNEADPAVKFGVTPTGTIMFGDLKVERSKLEESLKKLEAEKKQQDEMIKRLREKISQMETEGAASLDKKLRDELARFEKIIKEIKERNKPEGSDD
jgi:S1-C subfamily serine protease